MAAKVIIASEPQRGSRNIEDEVAFLRWTDQEAGISQETSKLLKSEGFCTLEDLRGIAQGDLEVLNLDASEREKLEVALLQLNTRASQTSQPPTPKSSSNRPSSAEKQKENSNTEEASANEANEKQSCKSKRQLYPDLRGYENEFSDPEPDLHHPITMPVDPSEPQTPPKHEQVSPKATAASGDTESNNDSALTSSVKRKKKDSKGSKSRPMSIPTSGPSLMNDYLGGTPGGDEMTSGSPLSPNSLGSSLLNRFKISKDKEEKKEKEAKVKGDKKPKVKNPFKKKKRPSGDTDIAQITADMSQIGRGQDDSTPATGELEESVDSQRMSGVPVEDHPLIPVEEVEETPEVKSLKHKFLEQSTLVRTGFPETYQLPQVTISRDENSSIRHCEIAVPDFPVELVFQEKVLLCVGASGAGKTTLINGLANYLLDVEWEDSFRFQIIPDKDDKAEFDSESQTKMITAYTFYVEKDLQPYKVTIIDTPGFGDTKGIDQDQELDNKIRNLFDDSKKYGLDKLDAVCFCTQASETRMNAFQRYIYHRVLSIFGKDVESNIFMMVTFSDAQEPQVVRLLKENNIPFNKFFKFNNSALFASNKSGLDNDNGNDADGDNSDNEMEEEGNAIFNQLYWRMGTSSFQSFLEYVDRKVEPVTLSLTKEVMAQRESLQVYIVGLQENVKKGLQTLDHIRQEWQVVKQHEADIARNRDFTYSVKEFYTEKVEKPPGRHVTNCQQCNRTCHLNCKYANDEEKAKCSAMDSEGYCKICTPPQGGKCHWSVHFNMSYYFLFKERVVEKRSDELFEKYSQALDKKIDSESLLAKIGDTFANIQGEVIWQTNEIRKCLNQLSEIALKPNPLTTVDYIDQMIIAERDTCQPGWRERVYQLENARKHAEYLQKLQDEGYDPWEEQSSAMQPVGDTSSTSSALPVSDQTKDSRLHSVTEFLHKLKNGMWGFISDDTNAPATSSSVDPHPLYDHDEDEDDTRSRRSVSVRVPIPTACETAGLI